LAAPRFPRRRNLGDAVADRSRSRGLSARCSQRAFWGERTVSPKRGSRYPIPSLYCQAASLGHPAHALLKLWSPKQDQGSPRGQSAPVRFGLPCVIAADGELSGSPHHPIKWGSTSLLLRRLLLTSLSICKGHFCKCKTVS